MKNCVVKISLGTKCVRVCIHAYERKALSGIKLFVQQQ